MKIGSIDILDLKLGSAQINEVRHGANLVWQKTAPPVGYDADYQAVLDYATANSIPLPTTAQQDLDNQFILDYKATGAWDIDDVVLRTASTASTAFRLICWKRRIQCSQFGSLIWTDSGVEGNGVNGYIDPHYNLSTATNYKLDNAGFMYFGTKLPRETKAVIAVYTGTTNDYLLFGPYLASETSGDAYLFMNNGIVMTTHSTIPTSGLTALYRTSETGSGSNVRGAYQNYTTSAQGQAGVAIANHSPFVLARKRADTSSVDLYSTENMKFITIGGSKRDLHNDLKTLNY